MSSARWRQNAAFWWLALLLGLFLAAASAPSPLYVIYQSEWHFSAGTLTAVYAVYAFGALAALLIAGRLSDDVGRRPVTSLGLLIQVAAMLIFIGADNVETLFVARTVQGVATGIATGSISAWLIDLQPAWRPRLGSVIAGVALAGGLGVGALVSGVMVDWLADPLRTVFLVLLVAFAIGLVSMTRLPDVVERTSGWVSSLTPRVAVPAEARVAFIGSAPAMVAIWAIGGLYLALGPSLAISIVGDAGHVAGGEVIAALLVTAAAASYVVAGADPRRTLLAAAVALAIGVSLTLVSVAGSSFAGLLLGSAVTGIGFGPAFSAILRTLAPLAPATKRAGLLAAIYIEVYLSFSLPTIVAGYTVGVIGLVVTTYAYGVIAIILTGLTLIVVSRHEPETSV